MNRREWMRISAAGLLLPGLASAVEPVALREEVELVAQLLRTLHPGLWRYQTQEDFAVAVGELRTAYGASTELRSRYLLLSRFLARLRCGHTYCNFFNQRKAVADVLFRQPSRFPFAFQWMDGAMVVTRGGMSAGAELPAGTAIHRIQGEPVEALWNRLAPYARVDGNNPAKLAQLLSLAGRQRLEFFDVMHGLVEGAPADGRWVLDVEQPDGSRAQRSVRALEVAERDAGLPVVARDAPVWTWDMRADGIAVLRMPGWALYQSSWNWRGWLAERLDALATDRSARGLVVDVRGNEGGLDCGNPIIQRFAQQPSTLSTRRLVRFRSVPQGLRAVLDTWDPNFFELGGKAAPVDDQFFALPETDTTLRPEGRSLRHLPLRVLVDGANSSAAFVFAQRIQQDRLGLLVGTPTGGNQRGINGGAFFFVRLPHSGIEFDLPLIGTFPAQPVPDGGLNPDIPAAPTRADVSIGRDPALTAALRSMA